MRCRAGAFTEDALADALAGHRASPAAGSPRQHGDAAGVLAVEAPEGVGQGGRGLTVHRVADLRPVDRHDGDRPVECTQDHAHPSSRIEPP